MHIYSRFSTVSFILIKKAGRPTNTERGFSMIRTDIFNAPHSQSFPYVLYTPENSDSQEEKLPLVVFLHGWGEKGPADASKAALLMKHGYLKYTASRDYPFIIAAPQCPEGQVWWSYIESLNRFLDMLLASTNADASRVILTGLSMGGFGTWLWGQCSPERFAALVPICGGGVPVGAQQLTGKPVWAFHGDSDATVSPEESLRMISILNKNGGNARLTLYPGCGHNSWEQAYTDEELIRWILEQRLPD